MEDIEYLEEYEDLILPTIKSNSGQVSFPARGGNTTNNMMQDEDSSSIDQDIFESLFDDNSDDESNILQKKVDPKLSQRRLDDRASLDSLDMLVKDLVGEQTKTQTQTNASISGSGSKACMQLSKKMTSTPNTQAAAKRGLQKASTSKPSPLLKGRPGPPTKTLNSGQSSKAPISSRPLIHHQFTKRTPIPETTAMANRPKPKPVLTKNSTRPDTNKNDKSKSVATVRPTFQQQQKNRLPPDNANRSISSSSSPRPSSSLVNLTARKQMAAALQKNKNLSQPPARRPLQRPPTTIVKPEKREMKDPSEDPLSLDDIAEALLDSDSDSFSLSDISDDTLDSLSDFEEDPHNVIDISNDSSIDGKINHKDLDNVRAETPSPTVSEDREDITLSPSPPQMKTKVSKFEILKRPDEGNITKQSVAGLVVDITPSTSIKKVPEKVTIISDTLLSRIDTALLATAIVDGKNAPINKICNHSNEDAAALERELMPFLRKKLSTEFLKEDPLIKTMEKTDAPDLSVEKISSAAEICTNEIFSLTEDTTKQVVISHADIIDEFREAADFMEENIIGHEEKVEEEIKVLIKEDLQTTSLVAGEIVDDNKESNIFLDEHIDDETMNDQQKENIEVAMEVEIETNEETENPTEFHDDIDNTIFEETVGEEENIEECEDMVESVHELIEECDEEVIEAIAETKISENTKTQAEANNIENSEDQVESKCFGRKYEDANEKAFKEPLNPRDNIKTKEESTAVEFSTLSKRSIVAKSEETTDNVPAKKAKLEGRTKTRFRNLGDSDKATDTSESEFEILPAPRRRRRPKITEMSQVVGSNDDSKNTEICPQEILKGVQSESGTETETETLEIHNADVSGNTNESKQEYNLKNSINNAQSNKSAKETEKMEATVEKTKENKEQQKVDIISKTVSQKKMHCDTPTLRKSSCSRSSQASDSNDTGDEKHMKNIKPLKVESVNDNTKPTSTPKKTEDVVTSNEENISSADKFMNSETEERNYKESIELHQDAEDTDVSSIEAETKKEDAKTPTKMRVILKRIEEKHFNKVTEETQEPMVSSTMSEDNLVDAKEKSSVSTSSKIETKEGTSSKIETKEENLQIKVLTKLNEEHAENANNSFVIDKTDESELKLIEKIERESQEIKELEIGRKPLKLKDAEDTLQSENSSNDKHSNTVGPKTGLATRGSLKTGDEDKVGSKIDDKNCKESKDVGEITEQTTRSAATAKEADKVGSTDDNKSSEDSNLTAQDNEHTRRKSGRPKGSKERVYTNQQNQHVTRSAVKIKKGKEIVTTDDNKTCMEINLNDRKKEHTKSSVVTSTESNQGGSNDDKKKSKEANVSDKKIECTTKSVVKSKQTDKVVSNDDKKSSQGSNFAGQNSERAPRNIYLSTRNARKNKEEEINMKSLTSEGVKLSEKTVVDTKTHRKETPSKSSKGAEEEKSPEKNTNITEDKAGKSDIKTPPRTNFIVRRNYKNQAISQRPEQYANAILTKSGMSFKEWQEFQKPKGVEKISSAENNSFDTPTPNTSQDNEEVVLPAKAQVKKTIETDKMVVKEATEESPQTSSNTSKEKLTNVNVTKEAFIKKSDKHIAKTSSVSKSSSIDLLKETSDIKSDKLNSNEFIVNTHNISKPLLADLSRKTSNSKSDKSIKIMQSTSQSTISLKTRSSKDSTKDKRGVMSDKKETLMDKKDSLSDTNEISRDKKGTLSDKETLSEKKEIPIHKKTSTQTKVKESSVEKKTIAKPVTVRTNKSGTKNANEKAAKTAEIEKISGISEPEIKQTKSNEEIVPCITNSLESPNQVKNDTFSDKKDILSNKKGTLSDKEILNEKKEILIDKEEVTQVNVKERAVEKEKANANPAISRIKKSNSKNDNEKAPKDIGIEKISETGEEIKGSTSNEEIVPNIKSALDNPKTSSKAKNYSKNSQNVIPSQQDTESAILNEIKNNAKDSSAVIVVEEYLHNKPENTPVSEYTHKSKKQHGTASVRENAEFTEYAQTSEACPMSELSNEPKEQLEENKITILSKEEQDNSKAERNITSGTVETKLLHESKETLIITQEIEPKHAEIHENTGSSKNNIVESKKVLNKFLTKNEQSEKANTKCEENQKTDIIGKVTSTLETNEKSCIEIDIKTDEKAMTTSTDNFNAIIYCETTPDKMSIKTNEAVTYENVNKTPSLDDSNNANEITSPSPKRKVAKRMKSEIEVLMESLPKGLALFNDESKRRRRELPCGRKHSNLVDETKIPLTFKTPPEPVKALSMITTPMKNPFAIDTGLHRITRSIVSADKSIKLAPWKSRIIRGKSVARSSRGTPEKSGIIQGNSRTKPSGGAPEKSTKAIPEKSTEEIPEKFTKAIPEKSTKAMPEKSEVNSDNIHKVVPDNTAKITHDKMSKKILELSNTPNSANSKEIPKKHTEDTPKKSTTEICKESRKPAAAETVAGNTDVIVGSEENCVRTENKCHSVLPENSFKKLRVRLNRSFVRKYWMNFRMAKTTALFPTTTSKSLSENLRSGSKSRTPTEHANSLASLLLKALNSPSIPPPPPSFVKLFAMPNFADSSRTLNTQQLHSNVATRAKVLSLSPQKLHPPVSLASTVQQQQLQPDSFNTTANTNHEVAMAATIGDLHCDESFLLTPLKTVSPAPSVVRQQTQQQPQLQKRSARLQQLIQKQIAQESVPAAPTQSTKEQLAPTSILQQQQTFFSPVEPKKEIEDEQTTATVALQSLSTLISGGLPAAVVDNSGTRLYSFLHPAKYNRSHGAVLLDYCCPNLDGPMPAIDPTRDHSQVQTLVRELPAYIVMTTKVVTRADLEAKNNSIPASIRKKMEKLTSASITASAVRLPVIATTGATSTVTTAVPPVASTGSLPGYTPSITALQKQLPSTTTLTPKILPFSLPNPTSSSESLPPLTPFSAMISSNAVSAETVASSTPPTLWQKPDYQRYNNLRSSMRRFDTVIKKYSPRICVLTHSERQRVLESVISHTQLSPRDIDIATHLLDDYCQQINILVPPKPISNVATPTNNTATPTTAPTGSNIANNFSPPVTAIVQPVPHPGNSTTAAAQKLEQMHASAVQKVITAGSNMVMQRQVPIFDKDRNVIGYQMQVAPAATNSIMSARAGIMSSKQTSTPSHSSAVKRSSAGGTPAITLKQPAQESPRIFYTKPIQTSTPISAASTTTTPNALEAAARLGRNVTIRHIAAKNLTPPCVPARSQMPSIHVSGGIMSKHLPKVTLGNITTTHSLTSTSFMQSPTAVTTSQRVTRHAATSKSEQIVIITKDTDGTIQTTGNPDESILPDDERSSAELKEIKRERDDELVTGRS